MQGHMAALAVLVFLVLQWPPPPVLGADASSAAPLHLVIPCFNEAARLPARLYAAYAQKHSTTHFTFVNDGSTDGTLQVLFALSAQLPTQLHVMDLGKNHGKAEATRLGLQAAVDSGADVVGFWDADLATPLGTVDDFSKVLAADPDIEMVFGARVALLGRDIQRLPSRHYLGRIFATLSSWVLSLRIYDTQCGAKLFRNTAALQTVIATPFGSRWIFDVEMIARFIAIREHALSSAEDELRQNPVSSGSGAGLDADSPVLSGKNSEPLSGGCWERGLCPEVGPPLSSTIYEFPLNSWSDIAGSKIKWYDKFSALWGLSEIWVTYFSPWASWTGEAVSVGESDSVICTTGAGLGTTCKPEL